MESDNQSTIIKLDNEYVINNTLKTIIDNVMKLDLPNDKKVKMLKYVLSINFDIKITNNPAIIDMIKELVGDDIVTGVARETYKRNQKRYYQTKIIDYSDDGFKIKKNIRYYDHKATIKEQLRVLKFNDDWNYQNSLNLITDDILIQMINNYNINYIHSFNKYIINKNIVNKERNKLIWDELIKITKLKEWKEFKIGDLIELVNVKKRFKVNNSEKGIYPLITRTSEDNGITKFINDYSIDFNCFTIAPSGSVGYCFYHEYFISVDGIIKVFKLKETNINPHLIAMMITHNLTNKYSYTNGLTIDKILNETVSIPIFE